jgi:TfoX/Sxy family transcriptional regulator of competence genes
MDSTECRPRTLGLRPWSADRWQAHERSCVDTSAATGYGLGWDVAYDEDFAHRIRELLADEEAITEKAMFGGLAFLLRGNMAVGISSGGELMVRVGPDATDDALARTHTRLFDMTGRAMKGWILVALEGVETKRQLGVWVARGVQLASSLPAKG